VSSITASAQVGVRELGCVYRGCYYRAYRPSGRLVVQRPGRRQRREGSPHRAAYQSRCRAPTL